MCQTLGALSGPVLHEIDIDDTTGCPFCPVNLATSTSPFDQVLAVGPYETKVIPALGMLLPGYLLLGAENHVPSFAYFDQDQLGLIDEWLEDLTSELTARFERPYVVAEHGACSYGNAGGCVIHAHLHLVPAPPGLVDALLKDQEWTRIRGMADLVAQRDQPYVFLRCDEGHFVSPNPPVPSQWIRRMVADVIGTEVWDWALDPGLNELRVTLDALSDAQWPTAIPNRT
jgi:diadenosine tetraphosphate (Ap4A) HIT family hydrolase